MQKMAFEVAPGRHFLTQRQLIWEAKAVNSGPGRMTNLVVVDQLPTGFENACHRDQH